MVLDILHVFRYASLHFFKTKVHELAMVGTLTLQRFKYFYSLKTWQALESETVCLENLNEKACQHHSLPSLAHTHIH